MTLPPAKPKLFKSSSSIFNSWNSLAAWAAPRSSEVALATSLAAWASFSWDFESGSDLARLAATRWAVAAATALAETINASSLSSPRTTALAALTNCCTACATCWAAEIKPLA